jgi:RND family efflux transporter MFP subunit
LSKSKSCWLPICSAALASCVLFTSCSNSQLHVHADSKQDEAPSIPNVGVARAERHPLSRHLTLSSELVPFQEIDVFAKESGYVKELLVDYGSVVKKGQMLAVLEIPEMEAQLLQDEAMIKNMVEQVSNRDHELSRYEAQHKVMHLEADRLSSVAKSRAGLVAQQEVDDVVGKDLASESQVEAAKSGLQSSVSELEMARAKLTHDQALYAYSKITAPFDGVVTQRYANFGTLMQAGTNSSANVLPLVRLSENSKFRLTIPVPESYVRFIRIGAGVKVRVPSLDREFPGKVARFSVDVKESTRTMHTEVDVDNIGGALIPGLFAEADLALETRNDALTVPLQAVTRQGEKATVMTVDQDNRIRTVPVSLGIETPDLVEIARGIPEGASVVVSDRSGLKDGQQVHAQPVETVAYQPAAQ